MNGEKCECRKSVLSIGNKFMKLNTLELYKVTRVLNNHRLLVPGVCLTEVAVYTPKMLHVTLNSPPGVATLFLVFLPGAAPRALAARS